MPTGIFELEVGLTAHSLKDSSVWHRRTWHHLLVSEKLRQSRNPEQRVLGRFYSYFYTLCVHLETRGYIGTFEKFVPLYYKAYSMSVKEILFFGGPHLVLFSQ